MSWGKPISIHQLGFVPDLASTLPGVISDADFCFPTASGARTLPALVPVSNALPGACQGAFLARLSTGAVYMFAGTQQHLYQLISGVWTEVDGTQTFNAANGWSFAQAGDDVIATDGVDPVQVFKPAATNFTVLAGSPPVAQYVAVVDPGAGLGFVTILANLASNPQGVATSKPGDDTVWTFNVNDLSVLATIAAEPGPITGLKTVRNFPVIFKASSLWSAAFVGPPYVWNFGQGISHQVGCQSNNAIVDIGDMLAFPGPDDFYVVDGQTLNPIPNQLRQWFFGMGIGIEADNGVADQRYLATIEGDYDTATGTVFWYFASITATPPGTFDSFISWNKKSGRWLPGHSPMIVTAVNDYSKPGLTYDEFTRLYGQYQNLPHLTYGNAGAGPSSTRVRAVIGPDGILYLFAAEPNYGYVQTGDIGDPIRFTRMGRARPFFNVFPLNQQSTLATFVRRNMAAPVQAYKTGVQLSVDGYYDFMEEAALHVLKFQFQADAEIIGWSCDLSDGGYR